MFLKTIAVAAGVISVTLIAACSAHADSPKFPDFSGYAAVDVHDYSIDTTTPGIASTGTYFLTPDGIICGFSRGLGAGCTGNNFPGIPPASDGRVNAIATNAPVRQTSIPIGADGEVHGQPLKTLPPLHSITVDEVVCGVDDSGTTACKDSQGRGFVLSPHGSGWLPHV
jgi:hypothetical protein